MKPVKDHSIRLAACMLLGAFLGVALISHILMSFLYGYDHGYGESARCNIWGAVIGCGLGLFLEYLIRCSER